MEVKGPQSVTIQINGSELDPNIIKMNRIGPRNMSN